MDIKYFLSEYENWNNVNDFFSVFDYIGLKSSCEQIFMCSELFFPEVIFIQDCFFIESSRQWSNSIFWWNCAENAGELEKYINSFCLSMFFDEASNKEGRKIIEILQLSWSIYFKNKFPKLNLEVETYNDYYDGWTVTVYKKNNLNKEKPELDIFSKSIEKFKGK